MQYNVAELELSWINAPSELPKGSDFFLIKTEDGNLGFVSYDAGGRMYMWKRVFDASGAGEWAQRSAIGELLPTRAVPAYGRFRAIGFMDGARVALLRTCSELLMVDLRSHRVRKVSIEGCEVDTVIPYMSFYTPRTSL